MRIAIVKLSAMGDIVHAMIVLQYIKNFNRKISIDWVVEEEYIDLLNSHPDINEVQIIKLKNAKKKKSFYLLFKEIKKVRKLCTYDLVIDMQGLIKSALISRLIPGKTKIGFDKKSARENLASFFYNDKFNCSYTKNVIERNIGIVEFALQINITKKQLIQKSPFLFPINHKLDLKLSKLNKNILLIPGASHISKCYPANKFIELTELLEANYYICWGSELEREAAMNIKAGSENVIVLDRMPLKSLISLVSQVDLIIGADTGPTHLAWALNIPSITLFGPTPGYRNTYSTEINKIIESDSIVNPLKINKNDFSIQNIDVNEIYIEAKKLLK